MTTEQINKMKDVRKEFRTVEADYIAAKEVISNMEAADTNEYGQALTKLAKLTQKYNELKAWRWYFYQLEDAEEFGEDPNEIKAPVAVEMVKVGDFTSQGWEIVAVQEIANYGFYFDDLTCIAHFVVRNKKGGYYNACKQYADGTIVIVTQYGSEPAPWYNGHVILNGITGETVKAGHPFAATEAPKVEASEIQEKRDTAYTKGTNLHFEKYAATKSHKEQVNIMLGQFDYLLVNYKDKDKKRAKELQEGTRNRNNYNAVNCTWAIVSIEKCKTSIGRLFDLSFFNTVDLPVKPLQQGFETLNEREQVKILRSFLMKIKRPRKENRENTLKMYNLAAEFSQHYKTSHIGQTGRNTKQYYMPWRQEEC